MAIKSSGIQVDRRVAIAMDALSIDQKAAVKPVLQSKDDFVAYANKPGTTRKIADSKGLYVMRAGSDMRIVFETRKDGIVVHDLMRKATLDRYVATQKSKTQAAKKSAEKRHKTKRPREV